MADNITSTSRLLISGKEFRNELIPRNLYNLDSEYEVSGNLSLRNKSKVADSIASILSVIPQWQRINPENSLLSRTLPNQSPLAQVGTVMLAQQLFYNSVAHISQQNLPSINISDALNGKNPFTKNVNMSITSKKNDSISDKVNGFVDKTFFNTNIGDSYLFNTNPTNSEYIQNTGKGQLKHFYQAINLNLYKQVGTDDSSNTLLEYSKIAGEPIDINRKQSLYDRVFFSFDNKNSYSYWKYNLSPNSIANANKAMLMAYSSTTIQEYAPNNQFIIDNFGITNKSADKIDEWKYVDDISDFSDDKIENKLIWGQDNTISNDYKIKAGLLEYTKNLLNATDGNFINITKKVFKEGNKIIGFNGSSAYKANYSKYANNSGYAGVEGVRQHTIIDPYDRFAKTIRFNGNSVYGGNPNSVLYKSVIPRIHPTKDNVDNAMVLNNKNLMFSIENLAVNVIKRDTYAVIDDEWATAIPLSEAGPFNGRLMWFPPYALELNEVATAKYESTVMVGRNEPMYNYQNSERSATLSFMLLIDYPEQLRNLNLVGENKNKAIADFFAFGGDPLPAEYAIEEYNKKITELENKIPQITGPTDMSEPPEISVPSITIFFPNDMPAVGEENIIIDKMYKTEAGGGLHYEIIEGCESAQDGNGWGLNQHIYYRTGLTETSKGVWVLTSTGDTFSQYSAGLISDQFGDCMLNKNLFDIFSNSENLKYYNIKIDGGSSKLYLSRGEEEYNKKLGNRRIQAAKALVTARLKAIFGSKISDTDIQKLFVLVDSSGSAGSSEEGAKPENMSLLNVKKERRATITIERNNVVPEKKEQTVNITQKKQIEEIQKEIDALTTKINHIKNSYINDNILNERKKASLLGNEAHSGEFYYPMFHSQTPEDFHKRLTFLQQCTRQGAAKRYDSYNENGELRASNSVFGRQPICILRVGDFFYTKIIIENVTIDYSDTTWDMNPEGFGMQPMIAKVTLQMKLIGGQSLKGPIDALQNAVSWMYYANSNYNDKGVHAQATRVANNQEGYINGILQENSQKLAAAYEKTTAYSTRKELNLE